MATKRKQSTGTDGDAARRQQLIAVMLELAFRGAKEESLMMRVANAGEINEVVTEIKRRRMYGKKMGLVRATGQPVVEDEDAAPRAPRRRKKKGATESDSNQAN